MSNVVLAKFGATEVIEQILSEVLDALRDLYLFGHRLCLGPQDSRPVVEPVIPVFLQREVRQEVVSEAPVDGEIRTGRRQSKLDPVVQAIQHRQDQVVVLGEEAGSRSTNSIHADPSKRPVDVLVTGQPAHTESYSSTRFDLVGRGQQRVEMGGPHRQTGTPFTPSTTCGAERRGRHPLAFATELAIRSPALSRNGRPTPLNGLPEVPAGGR